MAGILNIQIKSLNNDKQANLRKIEHYIKFSKNKKLDLVVIPEFFSTNVNYENAPEDENGGNTIKFIQELAKKYNTNIIAGTVVRKIDDKLYNTSFAIDRTGEIIEKYDKVHLFNYLGGNEGERITAGNEIKIAHFDFAKVGMIVCFDVRYPVYINKIVKQGAQIIVMPTAWVVPNEIYNSKPELEYAQDMFISMCRTRAYDNLVYFVASDLTKNFGNERACIGCSMIISPLAEVMANAMNKECAIYADIDINIVKYLKSVYPIANID